MPLQYNFKQFPRDMLCFIEKYYGVVTLIQVLHASNPINQNGGMPDVYVHRLYSHLQLRYILC